MPEHETNVRLATPVDERRWARLREDPVAMVFAQGGAKAAHEVFLPGLNAGHYGFTDADIRKSLERHILAATTRTKGSAEGAMTSDERFMWRLGFEAVAVPAIEGAMAQARAGAVAIIGTAAVVLPLVRPAGRRRLRAEDFGSLPSVMPWADRVQRAADHPSRGVGPVHGSGGAPD